MLLLHLGTVLVYALGTLGNSITLDERAAGKCAEKTETRFSARRCVQHCQIVHPSYIFKDLVVRDFDACIESCGKDRKCDVASYSRRTRKCYLKDSRALRSTRRSPLIDTIVCYSALFPVKQSTTSTRSSTRSTTSLSTRTTTSLRRTTSSTSASSSVRTTSRSSSRSQLSTTSQTKSTSLAASTKTTSLSRTSSSRTSSSGTTSLTGTTSLPLMTRVSTAITTGRSTSASSNPGGTTQSSIRSSSSSTTASLSTSTSCTSARETSSSANSSSSSESASPTTATSPPSGNGGGAPVVTTTTTTAESSSRSSTTTSTTTAVPSPRMIDTGCLTNFPNRCEADYCQDSIDPKNFPELTYCNVGSGCRDFQNDALNCGGCGVQCPGGQGCTNGVCTPCASGSATCASDVLLGRFFNSITVCKDLMNDNQHCGSCGRICYAPNGAYSCSRGDCVCPNAGDRYCYHSDNTITCSDFKTDRDNCGGCDQRCPAGESCQNGICGQYCKPTETFCAGIGCRDLDSDESSCGICGNSCGEGGTCLGGLCFCPSGYAVCNTLPGGIGGTCRNLYKDHDNCGSCNNICDDKSDCTNGSCQRCIAGSNPGYCPATGGCTNLDEDVQNCGKCGKLCSASATGNRLCVAGFCRVY